MPLKAKENIGYLKEMGITYSTVGTERTESADEPENTKILDITKSTETFHETESVEETTSFKSADETKIMNHWMSQKDDLKNTEFLNGLEITESTGVPIRTPGFESLISVTEKLKIFDEKQSAENLAQTESSKIPSKVVTEISPGTDISEISTEKKGIGSINETSGIIFTITPTRLYDEDEFDPLYETGSSKSFVKLSEISEKSKSILHKSNNEKYTISDNTNYFKVSNSVTTESIHDSKIVEEFKIIDGVKDRHSKHSFKELRKADKNQNLNRKIDDELKMRYENMHIQNKNNEHKNKDIEENSFHITIDNDMESVITEEIDKITNSVIKPIHVVDKYITKRDKNFNSIDKTTRINTGDIMQSELIRPELVAMREKTKINKSIEVKSLAADNRGDNFEIKNTQTEISRISDDKRIVNANTMSDVEINIGTPNIDENSKVNTKEKAYYVYIQDDEEEITTNIENRNIDKKKVVDLKENRYRIRREHIHSDDDINRAETIDSKFLSTIGENKYAIDADNPKIHVDQEINFDIDLSRFERDLEYILLNNKKFEEINRRPDFEFPPLIYEDTFGNNVVYRDFDSTITGFNEFTSINLEYNLRQYPKIKAYPLLGADEFGEICNKTVTVALNGCCEIYVLKIFQQQYDYEENAFKEPECARICQKNIFRMCFHFKPLIGYFDSLLKSYFSNLAIGSSSILFSTKSASCSFKY
ncbi:hypothetical protein CEXT_236091 [Caerostris extrusa]|uniref:Uncharacterized protein n=1 Tax=Caerostris extrusa TaxID=172846 RepID=A0AAV4SMU1_CAEEX|nr:hypothetical protein CEXT_236091 [Caerostris extrusa]